ncbi:MAG: hypothetical protein R2708_22170 [Vicinamibacterales bacterium]
MPTTDRALRRAVAAVLFVNAFLVFVLQPHISKRLLPVLGGSAEVWIVCSLFFQVTLLAGYAAAYSARRLPLGLSLGLHAALVLAAWWLWPFSAGDGPPSGAAPPFWTLQLLVQQVGLLFAAFAVTSPLLQVAYARAVPGLDPYPLFAASNAGSLAGLFSYPLLVEPFLTLDAQARAWSVGGAGLLFLLAVTSYGLASRGSRPGAEAPPASPRPAPRQRLRWLGLSFVPSVLLLAVTAQITTDIAPIPLLWTLPLGLYLGTFIRVFTQGWQPSRYTWPVLAVASLPMLLAFAYEPNQWWWVGVHLAILWCGAILCHGTLVQERPTADRLAEFYLWLALGGALGGVFAGIVAPLLFDMRAEYPLAVIAALWLAPAVPAGVVPLQLSWRIGAGLAVIGAVAAGALAWATAAPPGVANVFVIVPSVVAVVYWHRPRTFALGATLALAGVVVGSRIDPEGTVLRGRSFYGTYSVRDLASANARALFHGTTLHGLQSLRPERRQQPLSYYGPNSPVADVFRARTRPGMRVGVIGLGAGVILRYAQPGSEWTIYEIDPAIVSVARNTEYFSHWAESAAPPTLVLGDGRLRLRGAPDQSYDLLVVDAFASRRDSRAPADARGAAALRAEAPPRRGRALQRLEPLRRPVAGARRHGGAARPGGLRARRPHRRPVGRPLPRPDGCSWAPGTPGAADRSLVAGRGPAERTAGGPTTSTASSPCCGRCASCARLSPLHCTLTVPGERLPCAGFRSNASADGCVAWAGGADHHRMADGGRRAHDGGGVVPEPVSGHDPLGAAGHRHGVAHRGTVTGFRLRDEAGQTFTETVMLLGILSAIIVALTGIVVPGFSTAIAQLVRHARVRWSGPLMSRPTTQGET